jgi:P-type Cu+ transporter
VEQYSEHPLARAIVHGAEERGLTLVKAEHFQSITGKGVAGFIEKREVFVGKLLQNEQSHPLVEKAKVVQKQGQIALFVKIDNKLEGFLTVNDPVKGTTIVD